MQYFPYLPFARMVYKQEKYISMLWSYKLKRMNISGMFRSRAWLNCYFYVALELWCQSLVKFILKKNFKMVLFSVLMRHRKVTQAEAANTSQINKIKVSKAKTLKIKLSFKDIQPENITLGVYGFASWDENDSCGTTLLLYSDHT